MPEINYEDAELPRFATAYRRVLHEIDALPENELVTINIDVPTAVTTALGAWPKILSLRSELEAKLPDFDLEQLDKVETYARATGHAHVLYMAASSPPGLSALGEQVATLREVMCSDAVALAKRGLLDGQRLKELKGPPGYKNMAFDLLMLATMFRGAWSTLEGKTPLQAKDLHHAETLADDLLSAVGVRERASARTLAASDRRQRAFTLFTSAYDQTRRAISYLRWNQGDLDSFAPSLYAGRGNSKRRSTEETERPAAPASVVQPQAPITGLPGDPAFTA